jgi:hypothetical protein
MLTLIDQRFHLNKAHYSMETLDDESQLPAVRFSLSYEPLTPTLARALGHAIEDHCFSKDGQIRPELTRSEFRLRLPRQKMTVRMAAGVATHAVLRQVALSRITVTKRETEPGDDAKSKKVSPIGTVLRVTLAGCVSIAERAHRDFFGARFGAALLFSFEDEAESLPFAPVDAPAAATLTLEGDDAGDVLDEQAAANARINKETRRRRQKTDTTPRLGKGKKAVH